MNREALFCDGTQDYVIPAEPKENEKIKIRFRTAHNDVEEVHILTGNSSYPMWKIVSEGEFDFYEIEWQLSDVPFSYLFEVKSGDQICYFSRCGVSDQREDFYAFMIVPGFSTPEWPAPRRNSGSFLCELSFAAKRKRPPGRMPFIL